MSIFLLCEWWRFVMVKLGKLATSESQQCFANGIHLEVCDVVYEKKKKTKTVCDNESEPDEFDSDIDEEENDDDKNYYRMWWRIIRRRNVFDLADFAALRMQPFEPFEN